MGRDSSCSLFKRLWTQSSFKSVEFHSEDGLEMAFVGDSSEGIVDVHC